jgi:hypothetical protein
VLGSNPDRYTKYHDWVSSLVGRKLLSRPKRSRNEAVEPYEEEERVSS